MSENEDESTQDSQAETHNNSCVQNSNLMEKLLSNLYKRFHISETNNSSNRYRQLESLDPEGVAKYLKKCKNVICMIGAGVSTSAGIPDFRSHKHGLYSKLKGFDLPFPEAVFDLKYFFDNPKPFFAVAKQIFPSNFKPTKAHYFLRLLHEKGHLSRIYSQNIDMLEQIAGIPKSLIINAHGSFNLGHCIKCKQEHSFEWMKEELFKNEYLKCTKCANGVVKPDIVFFGEVLSEDFFSKIDEDFDKCDLLIIMGTSLKVEPFASLTSLVDRDCPRLLINQEAVGYDLLYDRKSINYRDVFMKDNCDDACLKLAKLLDLEIELEKVGLEKNENSTSLK